jgi:hypothetical protein
MSAMPARQQNHSYSYQPYTPRFVKGAALAARSKIIISAKSTKERTIFGVTSTTRGIVHKVIRETKPKGGSFWTCTCEDFETRGYRCLHIWACKYKWAVLETLYLHKDNPATAISEAHIALAYNQCPRHFWAGIVSPIVATVFPPPEEESPQ